MKRLLTITFIATLSLIGLLLYYKIVVERLYPGHTALFMLGGLGAFAAYVGAIRILIGRGRPYLIPKFTRNAALALAAYFIVDVAAGFLWLRPISPMKVPDPVVHHALVPNSYSVIVMKPDFSYVQTVNRLGIRGPDVEIPKPDGVFRIVMLGDSFTMGKGVEAPIVVSRIG